MTTTAPTRSSARRCGFPECTKTAKPGGLCISHGGGKKCSVDGCTTSVVSRGFCVAHGGGKRCQREGCTKSAQTGGFCWIHGGGKKCGHDGCAKRAQSGGACISHGGGKRCRIDGCNKVVQYEGLCVGHGGYRKCLSMNCLKKALPNGYCQSHGGNAQCHFTRCSKKAVHGGYCVDHRTQSANSPVVLSRVVSGEAQTISPMVPPPKQPRDWSRAIADAVIIKQEPTSEVASDSSGVYHHQVRRDHGLFQSHQRSEAKYAAAAAPVATEYQRGRLLSSNRLLPSVRRSFAAVDSPVVDGSSRRTSSSSSSSRSWFLECSGRRCCVATCSRFAKVNAMCLLHHAHYARRQPHSATVQQRLLPRRHSTQEHRYVS